MTVKPGDWSLILRPLPDPGGAPPECRMRMALKSLLRRFGLRCIDINETTKPAEPDRDSESTPI